MDKIIIGRYTYQVKSYDTDANGNLRIPSLLSFFQECAWQHAASNQFGYYDLMRQNWTWALIRLSIKLYQQPKWNEYITIETWNSPPDNVMAYRDFEVYNQDKQLLISASSSWLIIDYTSRRPQRVSALLDRFPPFIDRKVAENPARKLEYGFINNSNPLAIKIPFSAIDVNQHVNNAQYATWMLDALPVDVLRQKEIKQLDINFLQEALLGQNILIHVHHQQEDNYAIKMMRDDEKELVRMSLETN